jgi:hypothetical protein
MNPDAVPLIFTGFRTIVLILTNITIDESLFPMKKGYWNRFAFFVIRFGLSTYVIWAILVLCPFL